jgi:hypothetical protein
MVRISSRNILRVIEARGRRQSAIAFPRSPVRTEILAKWIILGHSWKNPCGTTTVGGTSRSVCEFIVLTHMVKLLKQEGRHPY